jgi:muconolactone delta-isomerase
MEVEVSGDCNVNITMTIDIPDDTPEEDVERVAREAAYEEIHELTAYCGNGGVDQLVGIDHERASLSVWDGIDWNHVS